MTRSNRRCTLAALLAAVVFVGGCAGSSNAGSMTLEGPEGPGIDRPEGRAEGSSADELDLRKDRLYEEFKAVVQRANTGDGSGCEKLCSLQVSICGVQAKLCNVADEHPNDDHYQQLCREAKRECQETYEACVLCVEKHAQGSCAGVGSEPAAEPQGTDSPESQPSDQ